MEQSVIELLNLVDELKNLETQIEEKKEKISALALEVGKEPFKFGNKYYQVRTRKGGKAYICKFDVPPGSWHKKDK